MATPESLLIPALLQWEVAVEAVDKTAALETAVMMEASVESLESHEERVTPLITLATAKVMQV